MFSPKRSNLIKIRIDSGKFCSHCYFHYWIRLQWPLLHNLPWSIWCVQLLENSQREEMCFHFIYLISNTQHISPGFFFSWKNTPPYNKSNPIKMLQMNAESHSLPTPIFFHVLFTPPRCASTELLVNQSSYRTGSFAKVFKVKVCCRNLRKWHLLDRRPGSCTSTPNWSFQGATEFNSSAANKKTQANKTLLCSKRKSSSKICVILALAL